MRLHLCLLFACGVARTDSRTDAIIGDPVPPRLVYIYGDEIVFESNPVNFLRINLWNDDTESPATQTAPLSHTLPSGWTIDNPRTETVCGGTLIVTTTSVTLTDATIPPTQFCAIDITARLPGVGEYYDEIDPSILKTTNGTAASSVYEAIGFVVIANPPPPKPRVDFFRATFKVDVEEDVTIQFGSVSPATLTAPFVWTVPSGYTITGAPTTDCVGTFSHTSTTFTWDVGGGTPGQCRFHIGVTATAAGDTTWTLPAGALQTDIGSNEARTYTWTVNTDYVTVAARFTPERITSDVTSQLTVHLDSEHAVASLSSAFAIHLPEGLSVDGSAASTCGSQVSVVDARTVHLETPASIPVGGCDVVFNVRTAAPDCYELAIAAGALQTSEGANLRGAEAELTRE